MIKNFFKGQSPTQQAQETLNQAFEQEQAHFKHLQSLVEKLSAIEKTGIQTALDELPAGATPEEIQKAQANFTKQRNDLREQIQTAEAFTQEIGRRRVEALTSVLAAEYETLKAERKETLAKLAPLQTRKTQLEKELSNINNEITALESQVNQITWRDPETVQGVYDCDKILRLADSQRLPIVDRKMAKALRRLHAEGKKLQYTFRVDEKGNILNPPSDMDEVLSRQTVVSVADLQTSHEDSLLNSTSHA